MMEADEPDRFFKSLADAFDTTAPLRWSFLLDGATEDQVGQLMRKVGEMGFAEVEPLADEWEEGRYNLWFAEVRVHTAGSFAARVREVEQFASLEGLVVSDFSAGQVE
jgi:hypothetical protein